MSPTQYCFAYFVPGLAFMSLIAGGWWTLFMPIFLFGLIPLFELVFTGSTANPTKEEEAAMKNNRLYDYLLYGMVPCQFALSALLIWKASSGAYTYWQLMGAVASIGFCGGSVGINVAHELGHRKSKFDQWMSKAMLLCVLYMHFFVEHNRGHHARVATDEDPASAVRGETVYIFWPRSLVMGLLSAWQIEAKRLARYGTSAFSWQNEVLRMLCIEVSVILGIFLLAGPLATGCFVTSALISILILETVNYIEHYGLRRVRNSKGNWGPVLPAHSWNANNSLGRVLLFELTRHSDHHAHPTRKYPVLRHHSDAPQLPTGYPGMIMMTLIPPLFFAIMHKRLDRWQARIDLQKAM